MVIVLAHWAEHLFQAFQIYALGWPVPEARGLLGLYYPWLIKSEVLHYGYALVMLAGCGCFVPGFTGVQRSAVVDHRTRDSVLPSHRTLPAASSRRRSGHNFFGRPVPTSLIQLWMPRVELHLFYNTIVFIPMVIGMYYHLFPPAGERSKFQCTCAWHRGAAA